MKNTSDDCRVDSSLMKKGEKKEPVRVNGGILAV